MTPRKFTRVADSFEAVDARGRAETVNVHQEFELHVSLEHGEREVPTGRWMYRTGGGDVVDSRDDLTILVVRTGRRLQRLAPDEAHKNGRDDAARQS